MDAATGRDPQALAQACADKMWQDDLASKGLVVREQAEGWSVATR